VDEAFKKRAEEAALWLLEREVDPPEMTEYINPQEFYGSVLRFKIQDQLFEYRSTGWHYDDNPWRSHNMKQVTHNEGVVAVASCPRHGGLIRSSRILTLSLRTLKLIGKVVECTLCSGNGPAVFGPALSSPPPVLPSGYCKVCAEKRFKIPKADWWKEPRYFTEENVRGHTRKTLQRTLEWVKDVECDRCVTLVYYNGGNFVDTYPKLVRTYER
jgi:hypothetical protein